MPSKKTAAADYPQAVTAQIAQLAQHIVTARKRRGESQAQWARKLGVSQPTMARIEKGDPSVAMASYVMCMWLINPAAGLAGLIAPQADTSALEREVMKARAVGKRARAPKPATPAFNAAPAGVASVPAFAAHAPNNTQIAAGLAALMAGAQLAAP
ncbi:XRE family transcriptional regulator [Rhodoferax sp. OV413]|uniref:XRE family transcriptional regulator n=1 Tax=Rhodoferax sp. OV413 TaxID=1855285 RepID=UPI0025EC048D|nr:XRE family transcriptional regulator [Rhodoferax sp. OV413]